MKFYFCEKCGKRITEKDLEQGAGRDKKLRGVYCQSCSVGVMTMETMPLTAVQARRILSQEQKRKTGAVPPVSKAGLVFCEKCGKRIPHRECERLGLSTESVPELRICAACSRPEPVRRSVTGHHPAMTKTAPRAAVAGSGRSRAARSTVLHRRPVSAAGRQAEMQAEPSSAPRAANAWSRMAPWVAGGGGLVFLVGLAFVLFSSSGGSPAVKPKTETPLSVAATSPSSPKSHRARPFQAARPRSAPQSAPKTKAATPAEEAFAKLKQRLKALHADPKAKIAAAEAFLKAHGGSLLGARVRVMVQNWKKPRPAPDSGVAAPASDFSAINDPEKLCQQLLPLGFHAPRDQVKRLGLLPPPKKPEHVFYRIAFASGKLDDWRRDYGSKISLETVAGEQALKVRQGDGRDVCYRNILHTINRTRVRLRLYQRGIKSFKFSLQTRFNNRFNIPFAAPPEGRWSDVEVKLDGAVSNGVRFANQPIKHIEVHGFRKTKDGWFAFSKFEIVCGGDR